MLFKDATSRQSRTASEEDERRGMKHWWNDTEKGKQNYWEKNLSSATLSATNPGVLGFSRFLCDRPANDNL